jgi:hypothetical protein
MDGLFPAKVMERPGAHHGDRVTAIVGLIELGDKPGTLTRNTGRGIETLTAESAGAVVHIQSVIIA